MIISSRSNALLRLATSLKPLCKSPYANHKTNFKCFFSNCIRYRYVDTSCNNRSTIVIRLRYTAVQPRVQLWCATAQSRHSLMEAHSTNEASAHQLAAEMRRQQLRTWQRAQLGIRGKSVRRHPRWPDPRCGSRRRSHRAVSVRAGSLPSPVRAVGASTRSLGAAPLSPRSLGAAPQTTEAVHTFTCEGHGYLL